MTRFRFKSTLLAVVFSFVFWEKSAHAQDFDFTAFMKRCGWGTVIGASVGLVSLSFEKRPFDSFTNVARGASLGLYGGIIYGIAADQDQRRQQPTEEAVPVEELGSSWKVFPIVEAQSVSVLWTARF